MGNLSSLLDRERPGGVSGRWTVHKHKPIQKSVACIRLWNSLSAEQAAVSLCLCPAVPSCAVAPVPLHVSTSCSQHSSTDKSQLPNSAATWTMPQLLKGLRPRCCRFTQCHSAQKQLQHNSGRRQNATWGKLRAHKQKGIVLFFR